VRYGTFREHFKSSGKQYVYSLTTDDQKILVVCSFTGKETKLRMPKGFDKAGAKIALQTHQNDGDVLKAYESRVYVWE
jgi:hypothetical protein